MTGKYYVAIVKRRHKCHLVQLVEKRGQVTDPCHSPSISAQIYLLDGKGESGCLIDSLWSTAIAPDRWSSWNGPLKSTDYDRTRCIPGRNDPKRMLDIS